MTSITEFFTVKEMILVGTIFVLTGLVFLLFVYAVLLRLLKNRRENYYGIKRDYWEQTLLEYLSDPDENITRKKMDVEYRDWLVFGEFAEQYLADLAGEDHDAIIRLLYSIEYQTLLIKALDNSDEWETTYALFLLGEMRHKPAEELFYKYVRSDSPIVSVVAFEALQKTGSRKNIEKVISSILNSDFISSLKVAEIIMGYGDSILPALIELLGDKTIADKGIRIILDVLSERNAVESLSSILKLAENRQQLEIQIGCIKALGKFGGTESLDYLTKCLSSKNWIIRSQAVKAIGNISSPMIIPELAMRLQIDENYWVKLYSAEAMKNFGERGMNELKSLLSKHLSEDLEDIIQYVLFET